MNAETLQDAISLLPEEMITDVDRLRRKKHTPWKGLVAAAACLCLLVGLWSLGNGGMKAESGSSAPDRYFNYSGAGMESDSAESTQTMFMVAKVLEVQEDRIIVLPGETVTSIAQPITVMLTQLEDIPQLTKNQRIRIYYKEETNPMIPYKIEIMDE